MKTSCRDPLKGNDILGDQRSRRLIDPTSIFQFMSSCKSHENAIQGHLVTLGLGAKNQTKQQDCMLLAPIGVYGQLQHGNTTKTGTKDGFADLTHQCESCIEGK